MLIIKNQAQCRKCGQKIESRNETYGYVYCQCGAIAVGGGKDSIMRLGHHRDIDEQSIKEYDNSITNF